MNNLRISTASRLLLIAMVATGAIVALTVLNINNNVATIDDAWGEFQASQNEKAKLLGDLRAALGQGGLIDHFKTYMVRQQDRNLENIKKFADKAKGVIKAYGGLELNDAETAALATLDEIVTMYNDQGGEIESMTYDAAQPDVIDKKIRVDPAPALTALKTLTEASDGKKKPGAKKTKSQILTAMRAHVGYGGMVHHFKSLIIRRDQATLDLVKADLAVIAADVEAYKALKVSEGESAQLTALAGTLAAYAKAADMVLKKAAEGVTPLDIDQSLGLDDAALGKAFAGLASEIKIQLAGKSQAVEDALVDVGALVQTAVWMTIGLLLVLTIATYWLLNQRIRFPLKSMREAMSHLAEGDLDTDVPMLGQKTEVGEMADAVQVFKDNALAVRRMAAERETEQRRNQRKLQSEVLALNNALEEEVSKAVELVRDRVDTVEGSARSVSDLSKSAHAQASAVASAAEQATINVQTVASAAE